jgi:hypothetical protein
MMNASEAFLELETRRIALVPTFDCLWHASVDIKGEGVSTKSRNVRSVSVVDLTSIGAVERLCAKLDAEQLREAA